MTEPRAPLLCGLVLLGLWPVAAGAGAPPAPPGSGASCPTSCDDGDPCTIDSCHDRGGCRNVDLARCGYPHAATVLPLPSGSACLAVTCPIRDRDGDGLNDAWEMQGGIDLDCDGAIDPAADLVLPGASVERKDVYLAYDYMVLEGPGGHSHRPQPAALQAVVDAFAARGMALHIKEGSALKHRSVVTFAPVVPACAGDDAVNLYDLKAARFDPRGRLAYHYAVFAHYHTCGSLAHCASCPPEGGAPPVFGATGKAELPGNDLVVSPGAFIDLGVPLTVENEAGLVMHELGHNLRLRHGGDTDTPEYKPNYLSVVNSSFTFTGIPVSGTPGSTVPLACTSSADCPAPAICSSASTCARIDYSGAALPALDELALDEGAGLGAGTNDITTFNCPDATPVPGAATGPIDWNCNGTGGEWGVTADINADGVLDTLRGHADWPNLLLEFQCTANGSSSATAAPDALSHCGALVPRPPGAPAAAR